MKVQVHPSDIGGCGHYRMIWPGHALADHGYEVEVIHPERPKPFNLEMVDLLFPDGTLRPTIRRLVDKPDADVIIIQRPLRRLMADVIPFLQEAGITVVVELDDDFSSLSQRNSAWEMANGKVDIERHWRHLVRACQLADRVTCTTPAIAERFAPHGRVTVIPNYVPEEYLSIARTYEPRERPWLGWSGVLHTHPHDLLEARPAINSLVRRGVADFAVVGPGDGVPEQLGIPTVIASGWQPLPEYPAQMQKVDVGVVPLELSRFNEAKSWLKGLEFAALGVPFLASPTGPYRQLAALGIGTLCDSPKHWQAHAKRLLSSSSHRLTEGALHRSRVRSNGLTVEERAGEWWAAWLLAANHRAALNKGH